MFLDFLATAVAAFAAAGIVLVLWRVLKLKLPLALTGRSFPLLFCSTRPLPVRPLTLPPMVWVTVGAGTTEVKVIRSPPVILGLPGRLQEKVKPKTCWPATLAMVSACEKETSKVVVPARRWRLVEPPPDPIAPGGGDRVMRLRPTAWSSRVVTRLGADKASVGSTRISLARGFTQSGGAW